MATFIRANIASLSASFLDYLVTILLVTFFKMDPFISSVTGTVCGGIFNFLIGRYWVFQSKNAKVHHQAFRYALVWTGNLVLNASGMFYLLKIAGVYYIIAKVIVSVIVGVGYNYVLQKKFVFK